MKSMTVKEMMELLKNYDENEEIWIEGGENAWGEYAELWVGDDKVLEQ